MHPSTPVVRSVVDKAFVFRCTGLDSQEAVAEWHCMVAQVLLTFLRERVEKDNESRYNLNKISTLWAVSELLAAREIVRERRRRNADAAVDYRKRQK